MSLLTDASLLLTPNAEKATKLYSIIPTNGNGDFTVTRATTATRTNSSGLIESTPINEPRLDYSLGSCPNILLEPQRTNLFLRSEEFDNASWSKLNSSVTANSTASPSGVLNADLFTANGISAAHQLQQNVSVTLGLSYSMSFYAKKDTNNFVQFIGTSTTFGLSTWANFDLNNGVVGSFGATATPSIQSVGNGWYRCIVTATATATASGTIAIGLITSATSVRSETNTLSTSVFLWGAQLEAGAYATTYIPTTSASVTRNADVISRNNIYTNGLISASGGTWFVDLRNNIARIRDASANGLYLTDSTTTSFGFRIKTIGGGVSARFLIAKVIAGIETTIYTTTSDAPKIAIKWNGITADLFQNGVKVVSASAFIDTQMQTIGTNLSVPFNINSMALFPTPLTDSQCISITS